MSGRTYAVTFNAVAITAAQDLMEISPADDKPIEIVGIVIGQYTDAGDAQDEMLSLRLMRGFTASGSGGGAFTAIPLLPADSAAGFAAEINNTTVANTGTAVDLLNDSFNVRAGYQIWFPPECRPSAGQGNTTIVLRITAPSDSVTTNGTIYVREVI